MQGMLRSRFVVPIVLLGALWSGCTDQIAIGGEKLTGGGGDGSDGIAGAAPTEPGGVAGAAAAGRVCDPSLYYYCTGEDGCYGQKPCLEAADGYGACECFSSEDLQASDDTWSDATGSYPAPADVPLTVPNPAYEYPRYPGDGCPTRPDLLEATEQTAKRDCGEDQHCSYGGCWWFCDVLLC